MAVVVAVALALGVVVATAERAAACSCVVAGAEWFVGVTDVGFVGTISEIDEIDRNDAGFVFEVELWLHGDLDGRAIEVRSSTDGAACGIEVGVGARLAVFATRGGDDLLASSCSTMGADDALAQLGERELIGGVSEVAVPLSSPRATVGLLDEDGVVIGLAGRGSVEHDVTLVSCPLGRSVVAVGPRDAEIIDLMTGASEVVELPLAPQDEIVTDVRCDHADGDEVRILVRGFSPDALEVRRLRGSAAPLTELAPEGDRPAQLVAGGVLATPPLGDGNADLTFVGEDGSSRGLGRVTAPTSWYDSVAVDPEGRRAVVNLVDDRGGVRLAVLGLPDGEVLSSISVDAPQWPVSWSEPDRIVAAALPDASQYRFALQVLDDSLRPIGIVEGWDDDDAVVAAGRLWGDIGFGLMVADVSAAEVSYPEDVVDVTVGLPAALVQPLTVAAVTLPPLVEPRAPSGRAVADAPDGEPDAPETTTAAERADDPTSGGGSPTPLVVGAGLLAVLLALGGVLVVRRRRMTA